MEWTPWSQCSSTCGSGATRQQKRSFSPGRHGAKKRPVGSDERSEGCTTDTIPDWPTCPVPATLGDWSEWSLCKKACIKEGSTRPSMVRKRACIPAVPSTREALNIGLKTCSDLVQTEENKLCPVTICPGNRTDNFPFTLTFLSSLGKKRNLSSITEIIFILKC